MVLTNYEHVLNTCVLHGTNEIFYFVIFAASEGHLCHFMNIHEHTSRLFLEQGLPQFCLKLSLHLCL